MHVGCINGFVGMERGMWDTVSAICESETFFKMVVVEGRSHDMLRPAAQPVFCPPHSQFIESVLHQFVQEDVMADKLQQKS